MSDTNSITPKAFHEPGYTIIPNGFFDQLLSEIETMSEIKVMLAIMRQTFGWQKDGDQISLSQLENMTGMNRQQVVAGCKAAINRGYVWREKRGGRNYFGVRVASMNIIPRDNEGGMNKEPLASMNIIPTKERDKESKEPSSNEEGKILSAKRQKKEWADASTGEKQAYLVAWLHQRVDERGLSVPSPAYKERLSGELRNALNEGRDRSVLFEALFHITNRWEHTKLSLWQALNDIDARKRRQQMRIVDRKRIGDMPSEWKEPEPFYDENGQAWIKTPRGKRRFVNADR